MGDIGAADLANAVTAFATILAGVIPLALTTLTRAQPRRWMHCLLGNCGNGHSYGMVPRLRGGLLGRPC